MKRYSLATVVFAFFFTLIGQPVFAVEQIGGLSTGRSSHTATRLNDGRVLIVGGYPLTASAEIYDPATRAFTSTQPLAIARQSHVAALLPDGRVLIAGGLGTNGVNSISLSSSEIYDPVAGTWTPGPSLNWPREQGQAVVLLDGRVLVLNGNSTSAGGGGGTPVCEIFDPVTGTFSLTGSLSGRRDSPAVSLLSDGRVLVAGGGSASAISSNVAEIFDPATGTWSATGTMGSLRTRASATLLGNGKVLIAGGISSNSSSTAVAVAELYDPATGTFAPTGSLNSLRWHHTAERLADGGAVVIGGIASSGYLNGTIERYDTATGTWISGGSMVAASRVHTSTLLASGEVLIAGGDGNNGALTVAALFDPVRDPMCAATPSTISPTSQPMSGFGGTGSVFVTALANCPWRVANVPSWITIVSGGGQSWGDGTVTYSVPRNLGSARDGRFVIADNNFVVKQAQDPCLAAPVVAPTSQAFGESGGLGNISVTRAAECGAWSASTLSSWITLTGATSGTGNGTVSYTVAANTGVARSGTVRVGTATHTVNQAANACFLAPGLSPSSQSFPEAGGTGSVSVTHPAACGWTVGSVPSWITITSGASGTGSGTIGFSVATNTGNARSASVSVGSGSFTVSQAASACVTATASVSPTNASISASGGSGTIALTYPAGCPWSITAASWITFPSGTNGVGSAAISYTVTANTGSARTHTGLVANAGFTWSQAAASPAPGYCASKGNTSSYEWIQQVMVAGQTRSSGNNGGYANFTSNPAITLARGTNSITLTKGGSYSEYWRIWIDFNGDSSFSDSEIVYSGFSSGSPTGTITVPASAPASSTRMRISMKYGASPTACETFTYGEVEDYTVTIP